MKRWRSYYALIFIGAIVVGAVSGGLLAGISGWSGGYLIAAALAGALIAAMLLWLRDIAYACRIMHWVADEQSASAYVDIPQGSRFWAELAGRIGRIFKEKEERIVFEHAQLQQFLEALQATPTGVILLDGRNCLVWANSAAASFFELSIPQDYQQHITNLIRQPEFFDFLHNSKSQANACQLRLALGESQRDLIEIQMVPYGLQNDKLLLIQDVTHQERADQMRRDFVANVSHEIRTPLTVLSGFIETIQNLPLTQAERHHYLELMAQQSQRMHYLINDLLTLARLEGSPPPDMNSWSDIQAILFQTEKAAQELSAGRHILVFVVPDDVLYQVAGSETEISGALLNLVSNAIRYTPQGSQIKVSWQARADGGGALVVDDNGPGIEPEHLSRLSERFYRVDKSRSRQTGGTGLGLSIVKHTMQRHGGSLEIQSQPGKGASFRLCFAAHYVRVKQPLTQ